MAYGLSIRNRIEIFAESMGIGVEEFERQCGLPEGYVALVVDNLPKSKLMKNARGFPGLNIGWLLLGEELG